MRDAGGRALLVVIAVVVAAAVGSPPAQAARDTLVVGMPTDLPIFDTHKATGLHNGSILNQVSENLVRLGPKSDVQPWLVESWDQSKDGKTWTLHLRRGVKFTDGTPVNAEAIKVNIERFLKFSIGKASLAILDSMEVVNEILMDDAPALFLYGEPQIWAARKSLKGLEFSALEALGPLHKAHFEE